MILVTVPIFQSAYLLFDRPSFTAPGNSSFLILVCALCQMPSLLYRAIKVALSSRKVAWKAEILSSHLTLVAEGYLTLKESVTTPGIERNCALAALPSSSSPQISSTLIFFITIIFRLLLYALDDDDDLSFNPRRLVMFAHFLQRPPAVLFIQLGQLPAYTTLPAGPEILRQLFQRLHQPHR